MPHNLKLWSESAKTHELTCREVARINSALSDDVDVSGKRALACNRVPKRCFQGKIPGYSGFIVDPIVARELSRDSADVVVPYLTGRELLGDFQISRWAIDFRDMDMISARKCQSAFEYCQTYVLPEVEKAYEGAKKQHSDMTSARGEHLRRWWSSGIGGMNLMLHWEPCGVTSAVPALLVDR